MKQGNNQYSFFAFLSRINYLQMEFNAECQQRDIMEHSLQVAMIAHGLAIINNRIFNGHANPEKTALYAVYHDSNETITGDLPTPIKYFNPEIETSYKGLEEVSKHKLLSLLPESLKEDYNRILFYDETSLEGRLVKAADKSVPT